MSDLSPEARRCSQSISGKARSLATENLANENLAEQAVTVTHRTAVGVYYDGFTFAGNFAYLSMLAVFSFFIVSATIIGSFGQTAQGTELVEAFLATVPPSVAAVLHDPINDAMTARTGPLLWFSAAVGLWTTTSLIETIREILHNAYGVEAQRAFWEYRLTSIALIILSVFFAMFALSMQFVLAGITEFLGEHIPFLEGDSLWLSLSNTIPFLTLFATLYLLFRLLTPRAYRPRAYPKWPGAVFISGWWLLITGLLPVVLKYASTYQLTYGSLAGVIITLIFFYLVGLGMVIGAELNAALAERPRPAQGDDDELLENQLDE